MASDLVRKHFRDPEAAWDGALKLNDGGAEYLVSNLALVCRKELRDKKIQMQFVQICESIANQLRNYHISGNSLEMQASKLKIANVFINITAGMLNRRRAAEFLSVLVLDEPSGIAFYEETRSDQQWGDMRVNAGTDVDFDSLDLLGLSNPKEKASPTDSQSEMLVRAFILRWSSAVREKFQDPKALARFGVDCSFVEIVCTEVVIGLERTGGVKFIAKALEDSNFQQKGSWKSAAILSTLLNDFLVYTTAEGDRARECTRADGAKVKIFASTSGGKDLERSLALSESSKAYSHRFLADWAIGFYDMIKQNAFVDLRDEKMIVENQRLGEILEDFSRFQVA
jgi:hypothetical protein